MARSRRIAKWVAIGLLSGVALALLIIAVLTRTDFGAEQLRRYVLGSLAESIQGELRVGRITSGSLFGGAVVHDVAIDDQRGRAFLRADSARLSYNWRSFVRGDIVFERVWLYDPEVYFERLPGDTAWNFHYIFEDTTKRPADPEGEQRLIRMDDLRIQNGLFIVRTPWRPKAVPVEPDDTARLILENVPGGLVRVMRFEQIDGRLPRVVWESPTEEGKLLRVGSLSGRAYIWEDPVDVRDLRATVTIRDSIVAFDADRVRLPESRASAIGTIVTSRPKARVDIRIETDRARLADLRWLHPRLPDNGAGSLTLRMQTVPGGTLWLFTDSHVRAPGTELTGDFGIVTGDTLYFTRFDLRASPLDTDLLSEILGDRLPIEGLLIGTVEVQGPLSALTTRGDMRHAARGGATLASARWEGTLNATRAAAGVRGLAVEVRTLEPRLLSRWAPTLATLGRLSGTLHLDGAFARGVAVNGSVEQHTAAGASRLTGGGTIRLGESPALDLRLSAEPVLLAQVAAFAPAVELAGAATGDVVLRGPARDLQFEARLAVDGGRLQATGRVRTDGQRLRVHVDGRAEELAFGSVMPRLPAGTITGDVAVEVERSDAASSIVSIVSRLESSRIGDVRVDAGELRTRLADGLLHVDTLVLSGLHSQVAGTGTIALDSAREGSLRVAIDTDRLESLIALLPLPDSQAPRLAARLRGGVRGEVVVEGTPAAREARGLVAFGNAAFDSMTVDDAVVRFATTGLGSTTPITSLDAEVEGATLGVHRIATGRLTGSLEGGGGTFTIEGQAPDEHAYRFAGSFQRSAAILELSLEEAMVHGAGATWTLEQPGTMRLGGGGLTLERVVLARSGGARIEADGRLSWIEEVADRDGLVHEPVEFELRLERVPIAEVLTLARREPIADGRLSGAVTITGTTAAPVLSGALGIDAAVYGGVRVDRIEAQLAYRDRALELRADVRRGQHRVLTGEGTIPVDLALGAIADRHRPEPLRFSLRADSLPAAIAAGFVTGLRNVQGMVQGSLTAGGTTREPVLSGVFYLYDGAGTLEASGAPYREITATVEVLGERMLSVTGSARSNGGRASVTGTITLDRLGDPRLDLRLVATDFEAARRRDVAVTTTGEVRLTGRYLSPVLTGGLRVDRGALYLDELTRRVQIVELETPLLFDVVDTTLVSVRSILPPSTSPFVRNMVVNSALIIGRDFWLRSTQMNVELSGDLSVDFDSRAQDLRLTGSLAAVRGFYNLLGRRFEVRQGTVEFAGTPGIDPNLDILAVYRVRLSEGDPLDIRAQLTGTLRAPRVSLSTDADIALSQSDLASYLVFGRPTYDLAPEQQSALQVATHGLALTGAVVGPSLFGFAAAQLETAAEALGPVAPDYVSITAAEAGLTSPGGAGSRPQGSTVLGNWLAPFAGTEVRIGYYLSESVFFSASQRMGVGAQPGVRLEWRFRPTWSTEMFWEDRFARYPGLTLDEGLDRRKVGGFFLFREWGY